MEEFETRHVFERVRGGDEDAARDVFERYLVRLVALARSRLSEKLARKVDAEDVVQSAFRSFFTRAKEGQYAIERAGDLWSLLATITRHKVLKKAEHFRQQKRSLDRDEPLADGERGGAAGVSEAQPTDEEAIALTDEIERLMRQLDPLQRRMLEARLQGQTVEEVAETVDRSERTVRRFLGGFREQLEQRLQLLRED
ncbi:MAG: sigma-70 family RNA polymerase sigma factor [Pirellulaceae bacterium]